MHQQFELFTRSPRAPNASTDNLKRVLALIESTREQIHRGLAIGESKHESVFPKVARCLDELCDVLNTQSRKSASASNGQSALYLPDDFLALPLSRGNLTLLDLGMRRNKTGLWDVGYVALDCHLRADVRLVVALLDEFASNHLAPFLKERAALALLSPAIRPFQKRAEATSAKGATDPRANLVTWLWNELPMKVDARAIA